MELLVSVVVPVYNVEKYLRQCLDSVVNQTYRNLEILVVDDGSTDGSGEICDEYAEKDDRIVVFHTENRGLSAARNYAIDRENGEYIAFLDSDDWFEEDAVKRFLDVAITIYADIVACRFYQEYLNGTDESLGSKEPFVAEGEEILKSVVLEHKISNDVWNKFYKANLFHSIRYPEGRIFEDYATTYRLLQESQRLAYIPDCLIHYRNRVNSLSNIHSMKSLVDYWIVYHERFRTLSSLSQGYYKVALSECIGAVSRMWRWYAGCTEKEKKGAQKYLDEMQEFVKKHSGEIKGGSYSKHVKMTCLYARSQSPVLFSLLYHLNGLYRSGNKHKYFEQ